VALRIRLALLLLIVAVSGCGGSNEIAAGDAKSLVLRPDDLPRPFSPFYDGPIVKLDTLGTVRSNPQRFGREGGWIARYRRAGSPSTPGPLVLESRTDVFEGGSGAKHDLDAYRHVFDRVIERSGREARLVRVPTIGDESVAMTNVQRGLLPIRFYTVAWRDRNATASVAVNGFGGRLTLADALKLARAQERRLHAA
jgi:hypothetical protein